MGRLVMTPLRRIGAFIGLVMPLLGQPVPPTVSPEAPDAVVLQDLGGAERRLSEYRGKVVVLNFWATWCEPCREEIPLLAALGRRYAERGVVVIGASADEASTQDQIAGFVRKLRLAFPIWKGATTQHMQLLGLGEGLPATAILDPEGRLAFRILGVLERREVEQRLEYLLAGSGPAPKRLIDRLSGVSEEEHHHGGVGMEGASTVPS